MVAFRRSLLAALALAALAACGAPARAAEVTVVGHDGVREVNDPFVPAAADVDLGPPPGTPRVLAYPSANWPKAVSKALARAERSHAITGAARAGYWRTYSRARSTLRHLSGARKAELGYVIRSAERLALGGRLTPSRMPLVFLQLRRNASYWPSRRFPASGDQLSFRGSELLFQYFPGRGLQFHPLSNFKKANNLHGACTKRGAPGKPVCGAKPPGPKKNTPCRPARLRRLLDELTKLAVKRAPGFIAWEYLFHFGGGSPPWISGMAQATAVVALGRAGKLLARPDYTATAQAALGAFETPPPIGVRSRGPRGGVHYVQYSFGPRYYVFNAFLYSLIGLRDFGKLTGDARATGLFNAAEPEAQRDVPLSDLGDWSRYSLSGEVSTPSYHELLREALQGMGARFGAKGIYCDYAIKYRRYQTEPPILKFGGPAATVRKRLIRVRFSLSKLSVVELKIWKGRKLVMTRLATMRRGSHSFPWKPKTAGRYAIRLGAKEMRTGRSLRGRTSGAIMVASRPAS